MRSTPRKPSRIEVREGLILVTANNTSRQHRFDFSEGLLRQLEGKGWWEDCQGYLVRHSHNYRVHPRRTIVVFAFHLVLPKREGLDVDHINRDSRDNRHSNLRYLSHAENTFNSRLKRTNRSGHNGVAWDPRRQMWRARITVNRRDIHIGHFLTLDAALAARRAAEEKHYPGVRAVEGGQVSA